MIETVRYIQKLLTKRQTYLQELLHRKQKELENLPKGDIRVVSHGSGYQYYLRTAENPKNGKYIPQKHLKLVPGMLQREYLEKIIKAVNKELCILDKLITCYKSGCMEEVYEKLPIGKKQIITPVEETDKQFLDRWLGMSFEKKSFAENAPEFYTQKGERVRSKSELLIADLLDRLEIPYIYESPLQLYDGRTVYPDFTLILVRKRRIIYWEHFGMLDDQEYLNHALSKIKGYEKTGFYIGENLILTGESSNQPFDVRMAEQLLRHIVEES